MPLDHRAFTAPTPEAEAIFRRWLGHLHEEFSRHASADRRSEIVRDELFQIYLGRPHGGKINASLTSELATGVLSESFDPRNATMATDLTAADDAELYGPRRPLVYFWQMFDRSPLGGNLWLGIRFRCMLGRHLFKFMGKGVTVWGDVEFARGYNLTLEDGCTVERNVFLNDTGPLTIASGRIVPAGTRLEPGP